MRYKKFLRKYVFGGFFFIQFFLLFLTNVAGSEVAWHKLKGKNFTVYSQKRSLSKIVLVIADNEYGKITQFFHFKPSANIKIYVYSDRKKFVRIAADRKALGVARPFSAEIAVLAQDDRDNILPIVVSHELTHVVMLQSLPSIANLPFWFVEGMAIYLSEPELAEVDPQQYALRGDLHKVEELRGNLTKEEQGKAAAEGYFLTKLIAEKFGKESLRSLVFLMQKGTNFDLALEKTTGLTPETLQNEWDKYVKKKREESFIQELRFIGFLILGIFSLVVSTIWLLKILSQRLAPAEKDESEG